MSSEAAWRNLLGGDLMRHVRDWMHANGHVRFDDALREVVSIGLAASPEDGRMRAAALAIHARIRKQVLQDVYAALTESAERIKNQLPELVRDARAGA